MALTHLNGLASMTLAAVLAAGCDIEAQIAAQIATTNGSFDRTLQVGGPVRLSITNGAGDVRVTSGPDNSVHVVGRISAHESPLSDLSASEKVQRIETHPPIVQDGDLIRIGEIGDRRLANNLRIDYDIIVPARTSVISKTGSGDQVIGAISGPVEVAAGSGDLTVGPIGSSATVATGSGDIEVRGAAGDATMKAGSGDITATQVTGRLTAKTGSGDVNVDGHPAADWSIRTGSGDIDVRVPGDAPFTLDAATSSGRVDVAHALDANAARSRHHASGTFGGGGARVALSAASGSIRVR